MENKLILALFNRTFITFIVSENLTTWSQNLENTAHFSIILKLKINFNIIVLN